MVAKNGFCFGSVSCPCGVDLGVLHPFLPLQGQALPVRQQLRQAGVVLPGARPPVDRSKRKTLNDKTKVRPAPAGPHSCLYIMIWWISYPRIPPRLLRECSRARTGAPVAPEPRTFENPVPELGSSCGGPGGVSSQILG